MFRAENTIYYHHDAAAGGTVEKAESFPLQLGYVRLGPGHTRQLQELQPKIFQKTDIHGAKEASFLILNLEQLGKRKAFQNSFRAQYDLWSTLLNENGNDVATMFGQVERHYLQDEKVQINKKLMKDLLINTVSCVRIFNKFIHNNAQIHLLKEIDTDMFHYMLTRYDELTSVVLGTSKDIDRSWSTFNFETYAIGMYILYLKGIKTVFTEKTERVHQ